MQSLVDSLPQCSVVIDPLTLDDGSLDEHTGIRSVRFDLDNQHRSRSPSITRHSRRRHSSSSQSPERSMSRKSLSQTRRSHSRHHRHRRYSSSSQSPDRKYCSRRRSSRYHRYSSKSSGRKSRSHRRNHHHCRYSSSSSSYPPSLVISHRHNGNTNDFTQGLQDSARRGDAQSDSFVTPPISLPSPVVPHCHNGNTNGLTQGSQNSARRDRAKSVSFAAPPISLPSPVVPHCQNGNTNGRTQGAPNPARRRGRVQSVSGKFLAIYLYWKLLLVYLLNFYVVLFTAPPDKLRKAEPVNARSQAISMPAMQQAVRSAQSAIHK